MSRWLLACSCVLAGAAAGTALIAPLMQGVIPVAAEPAAGQPVTGIPKELTSYRDVVKKVLPAVVSIEAKAKAAKRQDQPRRRQRDEDDDGGQDPLRRFQEDPQREPERDSFGSGFLVDPKGIILTNYHVVEGAGQVTVHLTDGRKFTSIEIKSDPKTDLALVKIDAKEPLPFLEFGDSSAMEIGDRVLAVGAPFGLAGSVTAGIVSAKGRSLRLNMYEDFVQTDAAVNPGNSGGPLVNLEGKVIGINSAIKSRNGGFQGVSMAIASNLAKSVMDQLLKDGVVHRGYLGVHIKDVIDREIAKRLGVPERGGVLISEALEAAPAAKAGLLGGDVIIELAGKPIREGRELQMIVAGLPLGKPVEVKVIRDGKEKVLPITINEQPEDLGRGRGVQPRLPRRDDDAVSLEGVGLEVVDLTPEIAKRLGYKGDAKGAIIVHVEEGTPGAAADLYRGLVVLQADGKPVKSASELKTMLQKSKLADGVLLQVWSPIPQARGVDYKIVRAAK